jgi:hypothetical protein
MQVIRGAWVCVAIFGAVFLTRGLAEAQSVPVDLRLVLAVDVSRSMNAEEQYLQRVGYVQAFQNPIVIEAIQRGPLGRIAVTYVEWAGEQHVTVPWTLLDSRRAAEAFADRLLRKPTRVARRTSISGALLFSASLFDDPTFTGRRRVIDISGDGPNNLGPRVVGARDWVIAKGITINGLPILARGTSLAGFFDVQNLDRYYEDCVIGGPGAFIVPVLETGGFAAAILRKIILEIAGLTPPPSPQTPPRILSAQFSRDTGPFDCLVGEKLWREFMGGSEP